MACANLLLPKEIIALGLALADAPSLETLSLRGSPLGKHGITTLAPSLAAAPLLHTLDLGSCRLGDAGARTPRRSCPHRSAGSISRTTTWATMACAPSPALSRAQMQPPSPISI